MKATLLSLAVVFALLDVSVAAAGDSVLLTPENAEQHGYWVRCGVLDRDAEHRTGVAQHWQQADPPVVYFRLGLKHGGRLHKGPFAVNQKDLQVIKSISLVVRNDEAVLVKVPLRCEFDAGNYIHLHAEFSAQREMVSKMQVVFDEHGETGKRAVVIDLKPFIANP